MARKPPPEHTRFKPGQSGNPKGRKKIPPDLLEVKELDKHELKRLFAKYARMNKSQILNALKDENTPIIELVIANGLAQAAKNGDYSRLNFILDRTIGKITDEKYSFEENKTPLQSAHLAVVKMIAQQENKIIDVEHE